MAHIIVVGARSLLDRAEDGCLVADSLVGARKFTDGRPSISVLERPQSARKTEDK